MNWLVFEIETVWFVWESGFSTRTKRLQARVP